MTAEELPRLVIDIYLFIVVPYMEFTTAVRIA